MSNDTSSMIKDLAGLRFGSLVVVAKIASESKSGGPLWQVTCDCGKPTTKRQNRLVSKFKPARTCSSKCPIFISTYRVRTKRHPMYEMWAGMLARCRNPKAINFGNYGGRGIQVCERWHHFENFLADMGERPTPKHLLERVDNDDGYHPGNCKWATRRENFFNKRNNIMTMEQADTYIANGLHKTTVMDRIYNGWSVESAISTPAKKSKVTA